VTESKNQLDTHSKKKVWHF